MSTERDGGADDGLAPVIPLFGGSGARETAGDGHDRAPQEHDPAPTSAPRRFPVRHLPAEGGAPADGGVPAEDETWHTTWRDRGAGERPVRSTPRLAGAERDGVRFVESPADAGNDDVSDVEEIVERAEKKLMRSLGSRGLSVSEARSKLRQQEVPTHLVDEILDRLERVGALDDERLAEQIVHSSSTRRNQGRRAIAQSLSTRGIAREIVDRLIADLPDDDAERAYDFARSKARQLVRYDEDTALRRLVGQLSRRGFGGPLAMAAAKQALSEARAPSSGVRFE